MASYIYLTSLALILESDLVLELDLGFVFFITGTAAGGFNLGA